MRPALLDSLSSVHYLRFRRGLHLAGVGNKPDLAGGEWVGWDPDGWLPFGWLEEFRLVGLPLLKPSAGLFGYCSARRVPVAGEALVAVVDRRVLLASGSKPVVVAFPFGCIALLVDAAFVAVDAAAAGEDMVGERLEGSALADNPCLGCCTSAVLHLAAEEDIDRVKRQRNIAEELGVLGMAAPELARPGLVACLMLRLAAAAVSLGQEIC